MNRELMKQCLDALEGVADWVNSRTKEHPWNQFQRLGPAIEALRAELAKPEPTPITWAHIEDGNIIELSAYYTDYHNVPLYTAPQDCPCRARRTEPVDWSAA